MSKWESNEEIKIFQEYLRIPTVHPDIDYEPCIAFLKKQAESLGLPVKIYYPGGPTKPILVMTWVGTQPELPSIVLNSHTDVVPVFPENWTHPPFGAEIDAEGKIYARGAQDMKCVGMQYLAAIRALKKDGVTLKRTIHIVYVPDEEIGGSLGMKLFAESQAFKDLNVGLALDEGVSDPSAISPIFYAERTTWHINFKFEGTTGHGSILHENTAAEKLFYVMGKFCEFRQSEKNKLKQNSSLTLADITSVNITILKGGVQTNVVPATMEASIDCRIAITEDLLALEKKFHQWCQEAGDGVEMTFLLKEPLGKPTKVDNSNPFWVAMKKAFQERNLEVRPMVLFAMTDNRFMRAQGIPGFGYSPMNNTPVTLHCHDEFLKAETYLEGIKTYKAIIFNVGNV